jgi:ribosomal protein S18 acetylase RimI-like enzyme
VSLPFDGLRAVSKVEPSNGQRAKGLPMIREIEIIDTNPDNVCDYGFCGYKSIKQEGYRRKIDWLRERFSEGMRFKILHSAKDGAAGFMEYVPGKYTWRAVYVSGYMVIHCIAIMSRKYKGKGYGSLLVEQCLKDAKKEKMHGVAVVTRKGTWMAGKDLFLKNGFEVVDKAPPDFELLVKRFKKTAPLPKFKGDWERRLSEYDQGLTIIRSDQCPYVAKSVKEIIETAQKEYGLKPRIIELKNSKQAQNAPSAFAIFSIIHNGKLVADHPVSNTRFRNIMNKELKR